MWICFYSLTAMAATTALIGNILWIALKIMAIGEGSRLRLHYVTRDNIAKLEQLIVNQSDLGRRELCLSMLHICKICYYTFLISGALCWRCFSAALFINTLGLGLLRKALSP